MATDDGIQVLVLQELRLWTADTDGAVARIVASSRRGIEPAVPLLTSIDDRRQVAMVRALHLGEPTEPDAAHRAALEPFVATWKPPKHYGPRITEHSESPPSHYRLAVTESGINNAEPDPLTLIPRGSAEDGTATPLGLLWIGVPLGTFAGLLILLGGDGGEAGGADPAAWPLPLSRCLGVRIYRSA